MFRTAAWYFFGWALLIVTYPMIWIVKLLGWMGRTRSKEKMVDGFTAWAARRLFYLTGSSVKMTGLENIPAEGPVLFVSNHQGHMDSIVIQGFIRKHKAFVSIVEVFTLPIMRTWLKEMKCVFLDRKDPRQALTCINQAIGYIREGQSMVVFPEGRLSGGETAGDFQKGWLKLATKTGVPIVPVTMINSYKALSRDGSKVGATLVECVISKPIPTAGLKKEDEAEFVENLKGIILRQIKN
ncbi:MAG: lysophospholipid acyltransferase family protein [Saccharofermentanales bacterium]